MVAQLHSFLTSAVFGGGGCGGGGGDGCGGFGGGFCGGAADINDHGII